MLGGGTWVTQNKILPGAYINVVSAARATATLGERGVVAIPLPLTTVDSGKVIEITSSEFITNPEDYIGTDVSENSMRVLSEVFKNATKCFIYNTAPSYPVVTITLDGTTATTGIVITGGTTTVTQLGALTADSQELSDLFTVKINGETKDWAENGSDVIPAGAVIELTAVTAGAMDTDVKSAFTAMGATTVVADYTAPTVADICNALEPYDFNVLACYTSEATDIQAYTARIMQWRDNVGKKVQAVVYESPDADHEGIINVYSTVSDEGADKHALVAWVAGAEAGCAVNASCTNKMYNGEYTVVCDRTQSELEEAISDGLFVFHLVYGDVRVLEDINSLHTTTVDKGDDFKSNQTIRVIDQIANDVARLFNTKYLGVIPNDASGRVSLWADIVKHHNQLQDMRAIQNFDSSLVTVEQGETKKSVVVNDVVNVVNAMTQLYMTIVVQ